MVEAVIEVAKEAAKEAISETLKEISENTVSETPIQSLMETIDQTSLECLEIQNEEILEKIRESRSEQLEKNREDGLNREEKALNELKDEFPESDDFKIQREQYLRDENGNISKDSITGESRRIDIIIIKDGKVLKSYEVTSETAPKEIQTEKENRIRNENGNYIKDYDTGDLITFSENVQTEIRRYP